MIIRVPDVDSVNDLPADYQLPPLGTTEEIGAVLRRVLPHGNHHWGQCSLVGEDFWLELNFGYPKEQVVRTHIGVRCNAGLGVMPILKFVCDAFTARLFDNQSGDLADLSKDTQSSMQQFADWRDRNLNRDRQES